MHFVRIPLSYLKYLYLHILDILNSNENAYTL